MHLIDIQVACYWGKNDRGTFHSKCINLLKPSPKLSYLAEVIALYTFEAYTCLDVTILSKRYSIGDVLLSYDICLVGIFLKVEFWGLKYS